MMCYHLACDIAMTSDLTYARRAKNAVLNGASLKIQN